MIDIIRKIADNDIVIIIALIGTISFAIKNTLSFFKKATKTVKQNDNKNVIRDIFIPFLLTFIGLICPAFLIFKAFSDWTGWLFGLTLLLSGYVILNFIILAYFIIYTLWTTRNIK